ncbi:hypothetical protein [Paenibacillus sacheonensis]|uniref:Uncharacterized protein n=1 Tax=Paenibacillus sacheonensis TaxID=742054 RepID=A0A7X4YPM9_9BACL|nr:hypothetical protein [Paenibacillus sacheonensis]MBM7565017.1 hypothetical protein [Paenibacillus sacheonensis]NBC70198.1 hypothetical protein [Paenibacillus sacheonensis]
MKGSLLLLIVLAIGFISGCGSQGKDASSSSADWAYYFVIFNDDIYEILHEEVNPEDIGEQIGEVNKYSDFEGIYSNGFSNRYPEGTKLYRINGVKTSDSIAVGTGDDAYVKARDHGKYGK